MKSKKNVPKSSRKSRKARVRASIFSSQWLKYEPSDDDWLSMETAIGRRIADSLRVKIVAIVQRYFRIQPFESNAPFLDDVLKRLNLITCATKQLQDVLGASQPDNVIDIVRSQLAQGFDGPMVDRIESLDEALQSLVAAAYEAKREFVEQSGSGFSEGNAWQRMVSSLKNLMRSHSMPHGASHSSNAKTLNGSPFVQFIQSLQKTFPAESLRRHHLSAPFALAREINRAARAERIGT